MQKMLLYTCLFIIVLQSPHKIFGNLESSLIDLNQRLKQLETVLVATPPQTQEPVPLKPAPQQKPTPPPTKRTRPAQPSFYPPKKQRPSAGSRPGRISRPTPAPIVEAPAEELGKQALEFTNQFRAENKKPPLQWSQTLADLSTEHSQNMGLGKVPFSHDGFKNRASRARFSSAAENVYMSSPRKDIARDAVDGWISSPGHRRNLLGDYRYCGIGAYKNAKGNWYFTQMFGK